MRGVIVPTPKTPALSTDLVCSNVKDECSHEPWTTLLLRPTRVPGHLGNVTYATDNSRRSPGN